MEAKYSDGEIG